MTDELTEPAKVDLETPGLAAANRAAFEQQFPGVLADGVVDAERLKELLDVEVVGTADDRERYGLMWAGKKEAVRSLQTPSRGTLIPDFEASADWDTARNVFIEGDNFEVLKLLQKAYNDQIKLIYIDPPYNTTGDFLYNDDFTDGLRAYLEYTRQLDDEGKRISANAEGVGRKHSRWLSMMYPRLLLARNLLTQDGVLFVSIDDNELANLVNLLNEIFGEENYVGTLVHQRAKGGGQAKYVVKGHDYVLCVARNIAAMPPLLRPKVVQQQTVTIEGVPYIKNDDVIRRSFGKYDRSQERRCLYEEIEEIKGVAKKAEVDAAIANGALFIEPYRDTGMHVVYSLTPLAEASSKVYSIVKALSEEGKKDLEKLGLDGAFDYPKSVEFARQIVEAACLTDKNAVVLDFFAGSGTTAQAVTELNASDDGQRRWLLVNLPEPTPQGSVAHGLGFADVAEVSLARIRAFMANHDDPVHGGLRVERLAPSNFRDAATRNAEDLFDLRESTLADGEHVMEYIAQEVLLKEGVRLDATWGRHKAADAPVIVADGVAVVMSLDLTKEIADAALALEPKVLVFLEDGFAGADAVKANAFTNAKNAGIVMKTV